MILYSYKFHILLDKSQHIIDIRLQSEAKKPLLIMLTFCPSHHMQQQTTGKNITSRD